MTPDEGVGRRRGRLLRIGLVGAFVAAVCCFTPVLVLGLAAIGLSALVGWLDYVLLPVLALFLGLALYAFTLGVRSRST